MDKEILDLWVAWNLKNISGDKFANKFGEIYREETKEAWKRHLVLKKKILKEMVNND